MALAEMYRMQDSIAENEKAQEVQKFHEVRHTRDIPATRARRTRDIRATHARDARATHTRSTRDARDSRDAIAVHG